jgi:hypothetical protein
VTSTTESGAVKPGRIWWAIGLGTAVQTISYGSLLLGAVASQSDGPVAAGPAFALGFSLVPIVFVLVAFVSGAGRAPVAALKAMGLWLLIALPVGLINPVTGLCAGFTAGAAVTLRHSEFHQRGARAWAVLIAASYVTVLVLTFTQAGIFAGAVTPLLAIKAADIYSERRNSPVERSG